MALLDLLQRRLVIVTGKGGVGKTTLTAAMARALAKEGRRVLCAEIASHPDTPSQLVESLGGPNPTEEPKAVTEGIDAVLITPTMGHRRFLQETLPLKVLADTAMRSQGLKKFLAAAPGFSDMGVMYRALDLMNRKRDDGSLRWDVMLLDSPATGHALALAQIPEFLLKVIPRGPIGRVAREGLAVLTDPKITACVVVTLPETLPVTEALELAAGLERHKMPVVAVVVNRVPLDPFSIDERGAITRLLDSGQGQGVYGAREVRRIERSEAALRVLAEKSSRAVTQVTDGVGKGPELAENLAMQLVAGR